MSVSIIPSEALPYAVGAASYTAFFTQTPPSIVLGAFAGSVIFLLGVQNKPKWQWLVYFLIAFLAGLLGATPVAAIFKGLMALVHIDVDFPHGLGAMFSAACTINVIIWFRDNPAVLLQRFKKGGNA